MSWKDDAKRRVKENKQGSRFKLLEGENTFRLLPAKEGPESPPYVETRTHYNLGPDKTMSRCGKTIDKEGDCWLCDVKIPELEKSSSKGKRILAGKLASRAGMTVQVSSIAEGKFGPPKPWSMDMGGGRACSTIILSLLSSSKRDYTDPLRGYNVTLERSGTGLNTTYGAPVSDEKPTKIPSSILAQIKSFDEILYEYSEEDQQAAYFGRKRKSKDEEGEEEEEPESEEVTEGEDELPEEGEEGEEGAEEEPEPEEESEGESEEYDPEADPDAEEEPEYDPDAEPEEEPEPAPPPRRKPVPVPAKKPAPTLVKKPAPVPAKKPVPVPAKKLVSSPKKPVGRR